MSIFVNENLSGSCENLQYSLYREKDTVKSTSTLYQKLCFETMTCNKKLSKGHVSRAKPMAAGLLYFFFCFVYDGSCKELTSLERSSHFLTFPADQVG